MGEWQRLVVCVSAVVILGCGGGGGDDTDAGGESDAPVTATATAVFDPPAPGGGGAWGAIPYPNDLYLDDDGFLALTSLPVGPGASPEFVTNLLDSLSTLDGAGVWSNVYIPIDGDVDPATLDGNVFFVDLEAGLAEIPADLIWRDDLGMIVAAPQLGTLLLEGRDYAAYVTSGARASDGTALAPSEAFLEAIDLSASPNDPAVAAAQESLRPLVEALGSDAGALVSATVFRTESYTDVLLAMRDSVLETTPAITADALYDDPAELDGIFGAQDPAAPPGDALDEPRNQPHGNIRALVHGTLEITSFLDADPFTDAFPTFDANGDPEVKGTHTVKYTLTLPNTTADLQDLPVAIYIPGITRTRIDMLTNADTAAAHGIALLAIDNRYHGDRSPNAADTMNEITGEEIPDGFGDSDGLFSAVRFFHLSSAGEVPAFHPQAMRENLRQAAVDVISVTHAVTTGDTSAISALVGETVSFRGTVAIVAESFGCMVSGPAVAVEPRIGAVVYSAPAAGFPFPAMIHSPYYSETFLPALTGPPDIAGRVDNGDELRDARFEPIFNLYNSVIEQGEASGYAGYLIDGSLRGGSGPHVLLAEVWGDDTVHNDTTESLAGAMGLRRMPMSQPTPPPAPVNRFVALDTVDAPVQGNEADGQVTAALTVWNPSAHTMLRSLRTAIFFEPVGPPFVPIDPPAPLDPTPIVELHAQWSTFVDDYFDGRVPTIVDPYAN